MLFCSGLPGWAPRSHHRVAVPLLASERLWWPRQSRCSCQEVAQQGAEEVLYFWGCHWAEDPVPCPTILSLPSSSAWGPLFSCSTDKNSEADTLDQCFPKFGTYSHLKPLLEHRRFYQV